MSDPEKLDKPNRLQFYCYMTGPAILDTEQCAIKKNTIGLYDFLLLDGPQYRILCKLAKPRNSKSKLPCLTLVNIFFSSKYFNFQCHY